MSITIPKVPDWILYAVVVGILIAGTTWTAGFQAGIGRAKGEAFCDTKAGNVVEHVIARRPPYTQPVELLICAPPYPHK